MVKGSRDLDECIMTQKLHASREDRRIKTRFRAPNLTIMLRQKGILGWRRQAIKAHCLDLNRYGMAIIAPLEIASGSQLLIDFRGKYICESSVRAEVIGGRYCGAGYRLSLQFSYCMDRRTYCREVDNALSRIEGLYNGNRLQSVN